MPNERIVKIINQDGLAKLNEDVPPLPRKFLVKEDGLLSCTLCEKFETQDAITLEVHQISCAKKRAAMRAPAAVSNFVQEEMTEPLEKEAEETL